MASDAQALLPSDSHRLGSGSVPPLGVHLPLGPIPAAPSWCRTQAWHPLPSVVGSEVFLFMLQTAVSPGRKRNREPLGITEMSQSVQDSLQLWPYLVRSCSPVPVSKLSGLMSVLSLVVRRQECSQGLEGPEPSAGCR